MSIIRRVLFFKIEDFSRATLDIRNELWEEVKELRKEGKYAALKYDKKFSRGFPRR